jgi:hypothetical protein
VGGELGCSAVVEIAGHIARWEAEGSQYEGGVGEIHPVLGV